MENNTLYLLDGHGSIFRAYYAYIRNPLFNSHNKNTSAVFGFFQTIKKIFNVYAPKQFVIVFDPKGPSFRKKIYNQYKAHRLKTPEDLIYQMPVIMNIVEALGIPMLCVPGFEADDVLATIAHNRDKQKKLTCIISSDKDLYQTLSPHTHILKPVSKKTEWTHITPAWLQENWQLKPHQVLDYLSLVGDVSDNVPGVLGVGDKTALALLHKYNCLEDIYKNMTHINPSWQKKLIKNEKNAFLSYKLVTLQKNVALKTISFNFENVPWGKAGSLFAEQDISAFTKISTGVSTTTPTQTSQKPDTDTEKNPEKNPPLPSDTNNTYRHIKTIKEINTLVKTALTKKRICISLQTTNSNVFEADIVGFALSTTVGEGFYIPFRAPQQDRQDLLDKDEVKKALLPLFDKNNCMLIFHDSKFSMHILSRWGLKKDLKQNKSFFDTLIAGWLCNTTLGNYSIDFLCSAFLSYVPSPYSALPDSTIKPDKDVPNTSTKFTGCFSNVTLEYATAYAAERADITLRLYKCLEKTMQQKNIKGVFYSLEMPVTELLLRMENKGIKIDINCLKNLSTELGTMQDSLQKEIFALCNKEFNIKSTKQLQDVLFNDLKLTPIKKNKSGFSTDVSVLTQLSFEHEVPKKILEYRHVTKLQNTYTDTLPEQIQKTTQRIHTTFNQNGTETGRISSNNPNLQNIPIKDALGQKIRAAFIAPKNHIFISADYSQIELVVLSHLSQDSNLIQTFKNNQDVHNKTASLLMNVEEKNVTLEQRRIAKSINFGIIYGMSAFRLSNELKIPRSLASQFIKDYFTQFSGVAKFIEYTEKCAKETGYIETILGRRREIPTIHSQNKILQNAAKRMAINTSVQGSAADIVKLAMYSVDKQLRTQNMKSVLILQIHDELLLECPKEEKEAVSKIVTNCMQNAYTLSVPLRVSVNFGQTWGMLK